jgi:Protein of unknown function (DUF2971)
LSPDFPSAQTLVFASCWTATEADEIALWKLYTEFTGVCIALPTNMFAGRKEPKKTPESPFFISVEHRDHEGARLPITVDRHGNSSNVTKSFAAWHVYGPTAISYFDDPDDLKIQCLTNDSDITRHSLMELGTRKNAIWKFENEFRFRIIAWFPTGQDGSFDFLSPREIQKYPVLTKFVDVRLDEAALNEAQITLGPKATDAHHLIVESLCARYAPGITSVGRSTIRIR